MSNTDNNNYEDIRQKLTEIFFQHSDELETGCGCGEGCECQTADEIESETCNCNCTEDSCCKN